MELIDRGQEPDAATRLVPHRKTGHVVSATWRINECDTRAQVFVEHGTTLEFEHVTRTRTRYVPRVNEMVRLMPVASTSHQATPIDSASVR